VGYDIGSVTSSDALEVGEDGAFPLRVALGHELSQQLFAGERNRLVEECSDLAHLDVVGRRLRNLGRAGLDEREDPPGRWRGEHAGFVCLLGQKVSVTGLLDSGTEVDAKIEPALSANEITVKASVTGGSPAPRPIQGREALPNGPAKCEAPAQHIDATRT
jgi:hypothetical protein